MPTTTPDARSPWWARASACTPGRGAVLRISALLLVVASALYGADPETPYTRIAKLATYISAGNDASALETFDRSTEGYWTIAQDLSALAAQTDVLCSIDVVTDKEADDAASPVHHLTVDWYMMLKSRTDSGLIERRRLEVAVTMQRFSGKSGANIWRITALSPATILAPITIK